MNSIFMRPLPDRLLKVLPGYLINRVTSERVFVPLSLIILSGAILRIYHLGTESLWHDKLGSIEGSLQNLASVIESSGRFHNQPPLYFVLLHFWMIFFGTSEIAVRSLSAIFGTLAIFVIYKVGVELFDRGVALLSGFLSAVSWFYIYYSQEARAYTLILVLTSLSFLSFIKMASNSGVKRSNCSFCSSATLVSLILIRMLFS
jgi:mannosyltransferase